MHEKGSLKVPHWSWSYPPMHTVKGVAWEREFVWMRALMIFLRLMRLP